MFVQKQIFEVYINLKQATGRPIFTNQHITSVHCSNANGEVLNSTMLIFKNNIPCNMIVKELPPSWLYAQTESGYINRTLFMDWFRFVSVTL
jgi:hypothetical protein